MRNGIIRTSAMREKKEEMALVRYSAAYPTERELVAKGTSLPWGLTP